MILLVLLIVVALVVFVRRRRRSRPAALLDLANPSVRYRPGSIRREVL